MCIGKKEKKNVLRVFDILKRTRTFIKKWPFFNFLLYKKEKTTNERKSTN